MKFDKNVHVKRCDAQQDAVTQIDGIDASLIVALHVTANIQTV